MHERLRWLLCLASLVLSYLEVKGRWRIPRGGRLPTAGAESPCRKQNIKKKKKKGPNLQNTRAKSERPHKGDGGGSAGGL